MTDIEIVQRFWDMSGPECRRQSLFGYRAWMLKYALRLYRIMLDGLSYRAAKGDKGE